MQLSAHRAGAPSTPGASHGRRSHYQGPKRLSGETIVQNGFSDMILRERQLVVEDAPWHPL
eukprot:3769535-Alexandrium_andersonii.AAC.1